MSAKDSDMSRATPSPARDSDMSRVPRPSDMSRVLSPSDMSRVTTSPEVRARHSRHSRLECSPAAPCDTPHSRPRYSPPMLSAAIQWPFLMEPYHRMLPNSILPNSMLPNSMLPNSMLPNSMLPNSMLPNSMLPNSMVPNLMPPNLMPPTPVSSTQVLPTEVGPSPIVPPLAELLKIPPPVHESLPLVLPTLLPAPAPASASAPYPLLGWCTGQENMHDRHNLLRFVRQEMQQAAMNRRQGMSSSPEMQQAAMNRRQGMPSSPEMQQAAMNRRRGMSSSPEMKQAAMNKRRGMSSSPEKQQAAMNRRRSMSSSLQDAPLDLSLRNSRTQFRHTAHPTAQQSSKQAYGQEIRPLSQRLREQNDSQPSASQAIPIEAGKHAIYRLINIIITIN